VFADAVEPALARAQSTVRARWFGYCSIIAWDKSTAVFSVCNSSSASSRYCRMQEPARVNTANGQLAYRFHARDVTSSWGQHLGTSVRFHVQLDGDPPRAAQGSDVDTDGDGKVVEQRLHQLIRQHGPVTEHTFEITFLAPPMLRLMCLPSARTAVG
jgi:hypothetical protein